MRKILFSLFAASAVFCSVSAQTKISFEASEGYTTGALGGQKGWAAWGEAPASYTAVSTAKASDGSRSVKINSNETVEDYYGIENPTVPFYNNAEISFDINVDALGGSDNWVVIYNSDYDVVASVDFDWLGTVEVYDSAIGDFVETSAEYNANQWYSVKIALDFTAHTAKYYVAGALVYEADIDPALTQYDILDLMTDDYGTSFYVDNIQIKDASLATYDAAKKEAFSVFPNPAVDVVHFNTDGKIVSAEIFDAAGKLVKSAKDGAKSVNVSSLAKGSYIVKVQTESAVHTAKIIKK